MFNLVDGSIVFYHSPAFGMIKPYNDLAALLHNHCPQIEERYIKENVGELQLRVSNNQSDLEKINIKESPYVISRRINALQRLFEKNILRDWNDRAL